MGADVKRTHLHGVMDIDIIADQRSASNALRGMMQAFDPKILARDMLFSMVGPILQNRIEERFHSEGDSVSGKWAALTPATEEFRKKAGFPAAHPINERTGAMKAALVDAPPLAYDNSIGATMRIPGKQPTGKLATKIKVAQVGDHRTPARPVLGMDEHDLEAVLVSLALHIGRYQASGSRTIERA